MNAERWFCVTKGLYFGRRGDGAVYVVKTDGRSPDDGGKIDPAATWTISDGIWASLVLTMTVFNERPTDWHRFMDYHQGRVDLHLPHVEVMKA